MKVVRYLNVIVLSCLFALSVYGQGDNVKQDVRFPELAEYYNQLDLSLSWEKYNEQLAVAGEKSKRLVKMQPSEQLKKVVVLLSSTMRRKAVIDYCMVHEKEQREILQKEQAETDLEDLDLEVLTDMEIVDFLDAYYGVILWYKEKIEWASDVLFNIKSERIREIYVLPVLRRAFQLNGYSGMVKKLCDNIGFCMETPVVCSEIETLVNTYVRLKEGSLAPKFSLPDEEGRQWHLSAGKGKMVYVIVWSVNETRGEKELEIFMQFIDSKKYNFPVEFVAIAVGNENAQQDWRNLLQVKSYRRKAVHLFCERNDPFMKDYLIDSLPRYIFIDKDQTLRNAWFISPFGTWFSRAFSEKKNNISTWNE